MTSIFGMFSQYKIIIIVMAALLLGTNTISYRKGYSRASDACAARELASVQRAIKEAQDTAVQDAEISAGDIAYAVKIRTVFRDVRQGAKKHAIEKPLPADCVLDDGRMRRITDSITDKTSTPPPATDSAMSRTAYTNKQ